MRAVRGSKARCNDRKRWLCWEALFSYQLLGWGSPAAPKHKHFRWRNWEVWEPGRPRVSQDHQIWVAQLICWRLVRVLKGEWWAVAIKTHLPVWIWQRESNGICNRGVHAKTNNNNKAKTKQTTTKPMGTRKILQVNWKNHCHELCPRLCPLRDKTTLWS